MHGSWTSRSYLLAAAPAGCFAWGKLLLHTGGALHLLGVKGHTTKRAERGGHLKTRLKTLPAEAGTTEQQQKSQWFTVCFRKSLSRPTLPQPSEQSFTSNPCSLLSHRKLLRTVEHRNDNSLHYIDSFIYWTIFCLFLIVVWFPVEKKRNNCCKQIEYLASDIKKLLNTKSTCQFCGFTSLTCKV